MSTPTKYGVNRASRAVFDTERTVSISTNEIVSSATNATIDPDVPGCVAT